jgi:hypothetical protein
MNTKTIKEAEYTGKVLEAKDNIIIEKRTGPNSVSISAPIDFVDGVLKDFKGKEIKTTITIHVEIIN